MVSFFGLILACKWDIIINTLYRLLLVMSVKNQVGSHFPLNLSCSLFIHRGYHVGVDFIGPLPVAIGLPYTFRLLY